MPQPRERDEVVTAADVAAFLRANPAWLAENPALYRVLAPPRRVHGETLADHMAAMLHAERAHAALMAEQAEDVLAAGRAAVGMTERVQRAVLALLRSDDPLDCINDEMPGILGVDAVGLCVEGIGEAPRLRMLPARTVARLMAGRQVRFRASTTDARLLHGEAAGLSGQDVLVAVPGHGAIVDRGRSDDDPLMGDGGFRQGDAPAARMLDPVFPRPVMPHPVIPGPVPGTNTSTGAAIGPRDRPGDDGGGANNGVGTKDRVGASDGDEGPLLTPRSGPPALLALLARDPRALEPGQGTAALGFLGQAVAAALGR
jgi:uncharacterized protein YigA (DUF484 family)